MNSAAESLSNNTFMQRESSTTSAKMNQIDTRKAAMLAYTNLENNLEPLPQTEWRRGVNTRNQSAKHLSADKTNNSDTGA
jgi:hypothetical protein